MFSAKISLYYLLKNLFTWLWVIEGKIRKQSTRTLGSKHRFELAGFWVNIWGKSKGN